MYTKDNSDAETDMTGEAEAVQTARGEEPASQPSQPARDGPQQREHLSNNAGSAAAATKVDHFESPPNGQPQGYNLATESGDGREHEECSVGDDQDVPGLPRLNYNPLNYSGRLIFVTSLLVVEASLLPIGLFYGLWYGTTLNHGVLFAIITSFFGFVTGVEFARRSWRLMRPSDEYRPLGCSSKYARFHFDCTHITLTTGYTIMTGLLIGGSVPTEPIVTVLALPVPLFVALLGLQLLVSGFMHAFRVPSPVKISSICRGATSRPMVYTFLEDIVAVDGGAGKSYRKRLMARWAASKRFRRLIMEMNWFWAIGALVVGIGTIVVIFTVTQEIGYGVGWASPLVFVTLWTWITMKWCQRSLRIEKERWAQDIGHPEMAENATVRRLSEGSARVEVAEAV